MLKHPLTDQGLEKFKADWAAAFQVKSYELWVKSCTYKKSSYAAILNLKLVKS
jgi:hypothetical protein